MQARYSSTGDPRWCRAQLVFAICALAACPGSIDDPERFLSSSTAGCIETIEERVFPQRCSNAGCHDSKVKAQLLDMQTPGWEARLIDVKSTCNERLLIDSANPDNSFMLEKVTEDEPECGLPMPGAGDRLSDSERQCMREWVNSVLGGGSDGGGSGDGGGGGTGDASAGDSTGGATSDGEA